VFPAGSRAGTFTCVSPDLEPKSAVTSRRTIRGQSVVEFALLLPVLLAFLGATVDIARVFQTWITLNSAVRDAAEWAASASNAGNAASDARKVVCLQAQGLPGFARGTGAAPVDVEQCSWPNVATKWTSSTTAAGATVTHPIATATVNANFDFRPLLDYPLITNDGAWSLSVTQTFSITQNR
jgi:Flp pilus assembly protein TadG